MIQSFETQLQVVLRALGDVVAPALAGADKHVVEQLHLSLATIGFVADRLPQARRYYRMELGAYCDLARQAVAVVRADQPAACVALDRLDAEAADLLIDPVADLADYIAATRRLREEVAGLVQDADGTATRDALNAAILAGSDHVVAQSRLWCLPFGFELAPQDLPAPAW